MCKENESFWRAGAAFEAFGCILRVVARLILCLAGFAMYSMAGSSTWWALRVFRRSLEPAGSEKIDEHRVIGSLARLPQLLGAIVGPHHVDIGCHAFETMARMLRRLLTVAFRSERAFVKPQVSLNSWLTP